MSFENVIFDIRAVKRSGCFLGEPIRGYAVLPCSNQPRRTQRAGHRRPAHGTFGFGSRQVEQFSLILGIEFGALILPKSSAQNNWKSSLRLSLETERIRRMFQLPFHFPSLVVKFQAYFESSLGRAFNGKWNFQTADSCIWNVRPRAINVW